MVMIDILEALMSAYKYMEADTISCEYIAASQPASRIASLPGSQAASQPGV